MIDARQAAIPLFIAMHLLPCSAGPVDAAAAAAEAAAVARCDKEVREYVDVLRYIRSTAGEEIGAKVMAGFVDEKTLREVRDRQGICEAARMIRAWQSGRVR